MPKSVGYLMSAGAQVASKISLPLFFIFSPFSWRQSFFFTSLSLLSISLFTIFLLSFVYQFSINSFPKMN